MGENQDNPAIVFSHCNPSIFFLAMLFIEYRGGMRVSEDPCCALKTHLVLASVLFGFHRVPVKNVAQFEPRCFQISFCLRSLFNRNDRL